MTQLFMDPTLKRWMQNQGENVSLPDFSKQVIQELKINTKIFGEVSSSGPTLVISNHPSVYDGFVIASLLARSDVKIVSSVLNQGLNPAFKESILPVYFSRKPKSHLIDHFRVPYWTWKEGGLTREQAHIKNRQTITDAAEMIDAGQAVIIFPSGSNPNDNKWSNGVSYLIEQIKRSDVKIKMIKIKNSRYYDSLRYSILRYILPSKDFEIDLSPDFCVQQIKEIPIKQRTKHLQAIFQKTFN